MANLHGGATKGRQDLLRGWWGEGLVNTVSCTIVQKPWNDSIPLSNTNQCYGFNQGVQVVREADSVHPPIYVALVDVLGGVPFSWVRSLFIARVPPQAASWRLLPAHAADERHDLDGVVSAPRARSQALYRSELVDQAHFRRGPKKVYSYLFKWVPPNPPRQIPIFI